MLKLTDIEIGTPQPLKKWVAEERQYVELDSRQEFIDSLTDKQWDWKQQNYTQSLFYREDNLPTADAYHKNYMHYLGKCWADHLGVILTPDILWYTLMGELVQIVQNDIEGYRDLFTTSPEKQDITIETDEMVVMPLSLLIQKLKDRVPTDTDTFLPQFSTTTARSRHAGHAMFCDMCSPYYNYCMYLCGIPVIDVKGDKEDYETIYANWDKLTNLFIDMNPAVDFLFMNRVRNLLKNIKDNLNQSPEFWNDIFRLEECGSGSDVEVRGWWTQLYREMPSLAFPDNFSTHIAKVPYKQLNTNKNYEMQDGLFFSKMEDEFLVPNFGFVVHEKMENSYED
jgi:hypothetical protein